MSETVQRRVFLLENQAASRRKGRHVAQHLRLLLEESGYEVVQGDSPQELSLLSPLELVVICGGDGTLNRAAVAVFAAGRPVALVPGGFWNNIWRIYCLPCDARYIHRAIDQAVVGRVPVGRAGEHYFFSNLSLGYKAYAGTRMREAGKRRWGIFTYARPMFRSWLKSPHHRLQVHHDGGVLEINTPLFCAVPDSDDRGPFLRSYYIRRGGRFTFPFQAAAVLYGALLRRSISFPGVGWLRTSHLDIAGETGPLNLDGETYRISPLHLEASFFEPPFFGIRPGRPPRHVIFHRRRGLIEK
jgi:hypothetical protein